jgi:hypothetical protein
MVQNLEIKNFLSEARERPLSNFFQGHSFGRLEDIEREN